MPILFSERSARPVSVRRKLTLPPTRTGRPRIDANGTSANSSASGSGGGNLVESRRRLANSTEGRFSILDERTRDPAAHGGFDDDNDDDEIDIDACPSEPQPPPTAVGPRRFRMQLDTSPSASASAFCLDPATTVKRGRWECVDWYDPPPPPPPTHSSPATPFLPPPSPSRPPATINLPLPPTRSAHARLVHEQAVFSYDAFPFAPADFAPSSNESAGPPASPPSARPRPRFLDPPSRGRLWAASPDFLSGRSTPLEAQLHGLERSLSSHGVGPVTFLDPPLSGYHTPSGTRGASVPPPDRSAVIGSLPAVPIDNKIEQAMDLVKTHLMFAVREEVEHLRVKIAELERSVFQLETENAMLREHVAPEVLQQLAEVSVPPGSPSLHVPKNTQ